MSNAHSNKTPRPLVRLDALNQGARRLEVDRAFPGRIRNASILTTGPALGHGFEVDRTTVEQVARFAAGVRGRWTHGGMSEDGLGRHLGRWEQVRLETSRLCRGCEAETTDATCPACQSATEEVTRAVGDFVFASSAYRLRPDGLDVPAPVYLMERAAEDPQSLGISIVARLSFEEPAAKEGESPRRLARLESRQDLRRGDWVADPAANPIGLHEGTGTTSELVELATRELDRVVARDGRDRAKVKALAFLARYFQDDLATDEGEVERLETEVASLHAELEEHRRAAADRRRKDDEAYLEGLRRESAAAQSPIPEQDMERVAALLRDGKAETAKVVGEAFLARSKAQGQVAFSRGDALPLEQATNADPRKATVDAQARLLRSRNWTVETSEDGGVITRAIPPGGK